jgi:hypothetical protein
MFASSFAIYVEQGKGKTRCIKYIQSLSPIVYIHIHLIDVFPNYNAEANGSVGYVSKYNASLALSLHTNKCFAKSGN